MSEYFATVSWYRGEQDFLDNAYSRGHEWAFDGGFIVPATSSPHIVPLPQSVEGNVDPEQAFVAALSSCHMLFFLSLAGSKGYVVDSYVDRAEGVMARNEKGRTAMTTVTLRPEIVFGGELQPRHEQIEALHHRAHDLCFIANSVTTEVAIEAPISEA
jgi:organic hydroperoxide reductase OsmC/OhrA